jgi:EpsI family protein
LGKETQKKLIILIICLLAALACINGLPASELHRKNVRLNDVLAKVGGWNAGAPVDIEPEIVKVLNLDDYLNRYYFREKENVSLYIGYYLTKSKVGAAHDPMVCFPGQGFVLSNVNKGTYQLPASGKTITYSLMTAQRNQKKDLIIYWFQSFDQTNEDTFHQKINLFLQQIKTRREDNAFVRITVSLDNRTQQEGLKLGLDFIDAFYPRFLEYVRM